MANPLLDRLKKASTIKETSVLSESKFFNSGEMISTDVPALNVALSGSLDGGFVGNLTLFCGPSKHFKTSFSLVLVKAYMDKFEDSVLLFYDSEFGTPQDYFKSFGIDTSRVLHTPITTIEELKFDIMQQLEAIDRKSKVIIVIDSIGNLASKKEFDDAMDGKSVADMSRAKAIKSLFRMVTPHLTMKDIPMIAINHTYQCGTEDMTVLTPDRGAVSLKDINVGDLVHTLNGVEEVSFTTTNETAWVTDIELENGEILSFTDGHRFMVNGEWKYVCDLREGDVIDRLDL